MSAFTDEIGKLFDEVKTKLHDLLDSSQVKNEETNVKQQVTQVIDDAKTDAGNLAKEVESDVQKDTGQATGTAQASNVPGEQPLTEQQQAQVADPNVDATNPRAVQNPVPAGTPQELNVDPNTQVDPQATGPNPQHIQQ